MADEEQQFDYHPDKTKSSTKASSNKSVTWTASEFIDHPRGFSWYALLIVITIALTSTVYLLQKDIFASGVILVLGIIVAFAAGRRPAQASYEVSDGGLRVGEKLYPYNLFRSFAIIHEGQLNSLVFTPLKRLQPPISAYFEAADEDEISEIIGEHLPYEQRSADKIDTLSRRLRF